jgi:predicted transposase/invertase (TIGR01784 family)
VSNPHDRLFQAIFSQPRYARPLLRAALPAAIGRRIDFRTLRLDKRSFIEERLRAHYTDLLFRVRIAGRSAYVYILFEHQSSVEMLMPVRLLVYMAAIWDDHQRAHPRARHVPLIVPLVLHHGADAWSAPTSMDAVYDCSPDELAAFAAHVPRFSFVLEDLAETGDAELRERVAMAVPRAVLWAFQHARQERDIVAAMRRDIRELLVAMQSARTGLHALALLMSYIMEVTGTPTEEIGEFLELEVSPMAYEEFVSTAERLRREGREEGRREGHSEGRKEGVDEGRRGLLCKLLALRFGKLSPAVRKRVERADSEALERWAERVLTAASLAEVFAEPGA